MPNLLVVVHSHFEAKFLSSFFNKNVPNVKIVTLPTPPIGTDGKILDVLSKPILLNDEPFIPDLIIVESNYGKPSDTKANKALLTCLLKEFPKASIVAYSSTIESLSSALEIDDRITIMGKGNTKSAKFDGNRVHSLTSLKTLMNQHQDEPEHSSFVTFAYDLNSALADCELQGTKESTMGYTSPPRPL